MPPNARQERLERARLLHQAALDLAFTKRPDGNITIDGERKRCFDFTVGPLRIDLLLAFPADPAAFAEMSSLRVRSEGQTVLSIRWNYEAYKIATFKMGSWENQLLSRPAGSS